MSNKRQHQKYEQQRELRNAGYLIHDDFGIRPNSGSESLPHWLAKCIAGRVLIDAGYRVDSEVEREKQGTVVGEVDLLSFGMTDRRPLVVETERDIDRDVIRDKLDRYNSPVVQDVFVLDVDDLPILDDPQAAYDEIQYELGLGFE